MKLYILEKNRSTFTGKTAGNLIYSINIFTGLPEISMFFYDTIRRNPRAKTHLEKRQENNKL